MKKILRYMQETAAHPSATTAYLSPPGPEPQQRVSRREHRRRGQEAEHHREFHNENHYPSAAAHTIPSHASGGGGGAASVLSSFEAERHQYAQDNLLQSYDVYVPDHDGEEDEAEVFTEKHWVIYIHGGYYRDPTITAGSLQRTLSFLFSSPLHAHAASLIAGVASINYRLSPHPSYPQDPDKTSNYELRNAKHPDHIDDVLTAIGVLQAKYGFGDRYVLVGHSVGATMAFQAALCQTRPWNPSARRAEGEGGEHGVEPPAALLGVEGIYDFPLLVRTVPEDVRDQYLLPTQGAFGKNESVWLEASPAQYSAETYARTWGRSGSDGQREGQRHRTRLIVIAHSRSDELVDWSQLRAIRKVFSERVEGDTVKFEVLTLKGRHHEVWERGEELARAIAEVVRGLKVLGNAEGRRG